MEHWGGNRASHLVECAKLPEGPAITKMCIQQLCREQDRKGGRQGPCRGEEERARVTHQFFFCSSDAKKSEALVGMFALK